MSFSKSSWPTSPDIANMVLHLANSLETRSQLILPEVIKFIVEGWNDLLVVPLNIIYQTVTVCVSVQFIFNKNYNQATNVQLPKNENTSALFDEI